MKINKTFPIVALFFISITFVFSQEKLTGKIVNEEDNSPIEFINVIIKNSNNKAIGGALTDSLGNFSIDLDRQNCKLQVIQFDEIYYEKEINTNINLNIGVIKISNTKFLKEISITTKLPKLKKELGKYIVENISNSKFSKGKNTFEILGYIPILNATENGISILNKGDATILIDGKSVGGNEVALSMIKSIPSNRIKKIEIITNPDSRYSADSRSGVINIVLKNNENEGLRGSVNTSIIQSYFNSQNTNGFISYSKKKSNITSGINIDYNKHFNRYNYTYNNIETNNQTLIASKTISKTKNNLYFLNLDYKWNVKNILGMQFSYRFSDKNSNAEIDNIFKSIDSEIINSTSLNKIAKKTPNNNLRGNINYIYKLDSLGSGISIGNTQIVKNTDLRNNFDYTNSNNTNNNFKQNQNEKFNINETKFDINKMLDENNKLLLGGIFIYSDIKNNFFHGNFNGITYISDPLQTNNFFYTDKTLSGYVNYETVFNDKWEGKIGLRVENFEAKGKTDSNESISNTKNTYLFPSLSLLFISNENNEFSLDINSYINRPTYAQLNPFIKYNSSNSYSISNPNLLPTLTHEITLAYSLKSIFLVNFIYAYDKNLLENFDILLPNNNIQVTTSNYGKGNDFNANLLYTNNFFNKNWNFTASFDYIYSDSKGYYNDYNMSFSNNSYSFKLKNQILLSQSKNLNMSFVYGYKSSNKTIYGNLNNLHSLELEFTKSYKDFNFSLNAFDILRTDLKISESKEMYNFYKKIDYFKNYSIGIRYNFGNNKVKKIEEKKSEINKRLL